MRNQFAHKEQLELIKEKARLHETLIQELVRGRGGGEIFNFILFRLIRLGLPVSYWLKLIRNKRLMKLKLKEQQSSLNHNTNNNKY